ncbi:MAG TPA: RloB family protein [Saprospiraceae bacterium]|nr:RloB family protein [Saprospiraceae bacterium]HMQ82019.1 RloB family protein [Saprospiraceae bacterium]
MAKKGKKQQNLNDRRKEKNYNSEGKGKIKRKEPSFLIVCGGVNTEPSYFGGFRFEAFGFGCDARSVVTEAEKKARKEEYDQIWCVFDKDDDPHFNEAIKEAEKKGFKVAYSNQAFEYWIILHFDDHQGGPMHRDQYHDKVNQLLKPYNVAYDGKGSKKISDQLFELLDSRDEKTGKERIRLAIERAKRIYNRYDHTNPSAEESSTTVFELVEEILKFRKP